MSDKRGSDKVSIPEGPTLIERFLPKFEDDLAVNQKKIAEV